MLVGIDSGGGLGGWPMNPALSLGTGYPKIQGGEGACPRETLDLTACPRTWLPVSHDPFTRS